MKAHMSIGFRLMALTLIVTATAAYAAQTADSAAAEKQVQMEKCFKEHGKLMGKPALMNIYDCWRVHAYLMNR